MSCQTASIAIIPRCRSCARSDFHRMLYRLAADAVLVFHGLFVLFVVLGGLLSLWRPRLAWLHIAAALWGATVMLSGMICPLTPLENSLRLAGGQAGYSGGFIEHYITAVIYPEGLTRPIQVTLGALVVLINAVIYAYIASRRLRSGRS